MTFVRNQERSCTSLSPRTAMTKMPVPRRSCTASILLNARSSGSNVRGAGRPSTARSRLGLSKIRARGARVPSPDSRFRGPAPHDGTTTPPHGDRAFEDAHFDHWTIPLPLVCSRTGGMLGTADLEAVPNRGPARGAAAPHQQGLRPDGARLTARGHPAVPRKWFGRAGMGLAKALHGAGVGQAELGTAGGPGDDLPARPNLYFPGCAVPKNRWHDGVPLVLPKWLPRDTQHLLFPILFIIYQSFIESSSRRKAECIYFTDFRCEGAKMLQAQRQRGKSVIFRASGPNGLKERLRAG